MEGQGNLLEKAFVALGTSFCQCCESIEMKRLPAVAFSFFGIQEPTWTLVQVRLRVHSTDVWLH